MNTQPPPPVPSDPNSDLSMSNSQDHNRYEGMNDHETGSGETTDVVPHVRRRYRLQRSVSGVNPSLPVAPDRQSSLPHSIQGTHVSPDISHDVRRQSLMAMDRKRRLTGSTQDGVRRRQGHSAFLEHEDDTEELINNITSSSRTVTQPHRSGSSHTSNPPQVIDLTASSPSRFSRPLPDLPSPRSPPVPNESVYVVPRWQPDSEVSNCPICKRPFSFLFRRHHCRKCGRVVCNECSPHRITIPRQYIVPPPGYQPPMETDFPDVIDLTSEGDDEDVHGDETDSDEEITYHSSSSRQQRRHQRMHSFTRGGGEKVRLCNPCVPDPQPEHRPTYMPHALPYVPGVPHRPHPTPPQFHTQSSHDEPSHGLPSPQSMSLSHRQSLPRPYRGHTSTYDPLGRQSQSITAGIEPGFYLERNIGRSTSMGQSSHISHGRYHSFDQPQFASHSSARPRVRSMFEDHNNFSRQILSHQAYSRPTQLDEDDICPVCRRGLPSRGADGDETEREAHIMGCITSRDPNLQGISNRPQTLMHSPPRGPMHMLAFVATEKDCVGEDGGSLECSICMVEYDVGEQLARLECLCKFHRECIVSWFQRKQECPVHKIA